jgi:hypothetical protein
VTGFTLVRGKDEDEQQLLSLDTTVAAAFTLNHAFDRLLQFVVNFDESQIKGLRH